jgi:hypothetical protein
VPARLPRNCNRHCGIAAALRPAALIVRARAGGDIDCGKLARSPLRNSHGGMRVDGKFVVEVRGADGAALPEVKSGEDTYTIARPGASFTVYVKRLDADSFTECVKVRAAAPGASAVLAPPRPAAFKVCSRTSPQPARPAAPPQVLLQVDGKCPGQAKRLRLGQEATFMGWLQEGGSPPRRRVHLALALHWCCSTARSCLTRRPPHHLCASRHHQGRGLCRVRRFCVPGGRPAAAPGARARRKAP